MNTDTTIAKNIRVTDEKTCDVNEIAENYIEGQPQVGEAAV